MKDGLMDALNAKRGGLVLKISLDGNGTGAVEVMPEHEAAESPQMESMEEQQAASDMAPPLGDEDLVSGMSDYDKEQAVSQPQKTLGGKARAAALGRMKK